MTSGTRIQQQAVAAVTAMHWESHRVIAALGHPILLMREAGVQLVEL
jgi:hypothetical protein